MKSYISFLLITLISFGGLSNNLDKGFKTLSKNKPDKALIKFSKSLGKNSDCALCMYGIALIISDSSNNDYNLERAYSLIHKAIDLVNDNKAVQLPAFSVSHIDLLELEKLAQNIEHQQYEHLPINDFIAFSYYIETHHNALTLETFTAHRNRLGYLKALEENTIEAYNEFIEKFPDAKDVIDARVRRNQLAFDLAKESKDVHKLDQFIKDYPEAKQVPEAKHFRNQWSYITLLEREQELDKIALEKQNIEIKKNEAEIDTQKAQNTTLTISLILTAVILGLAFYGFIITKRSNNKISEQKNVIEEKNTHIINSLNYAKYIQDAILPSTDYINSNFADAFVLYNPKDIVSGDFYWFHEIDSKRIIAVVDCTGHGVPGAFMSMIGNTLLNKIIKTKGILDPATILFELRKEVISTLEQNNKKEQNDGMDISLAIIENQKVQFAGAFNPLIHISKQETKVYKADRMPIGRYHKKDDTPFTKHEFSVKQGDAVFIYSDGYHDQFGGTEDKKFGSKRFKNLLQEISSLKANDQQFKLEQELKQWQGDTPQTDDVTVIGLNF